MARLPVVENAWLLIENDIIAGYGSMDKMPSFSNAINKIDAAGGYVFPAFCDSHTHLVYAGSREKEYTDKIRGLSYEEIARRGRRYTQFRSTAASDKRGRASQAVDGTCQGDHFIWHRRGGDKERIWPHHRG